jgi:hypothetical protein
VKKIVFPVVFKAEVVWTEVYKAWCYGMAWGLRENDCFGELGRSNCELNIYINTH